MFSGLFSAICANPQLCALVLDVLLDHFSQFYENDPTVLSPLIFEKTINIRNSEVTLQVRLLLLLKCIPRSFSYP